MKAPISCIAIFDGAEIFRDADCERVQSLQLAMTFNLLSAERDRLRTELDAARQQIEHRDALLDAATKISFPHYRDLQHNLDGTWRWWIGLDAMGGTRYDSTIEVYNALTSSGLDVPDGKEQDNDKNT